MLSDIPILYAARHPKSGHWFVDESREFVAGLAGHEGAEVVTVDVPGLLRRITELEARLAIGDPLDMISWLDGMRHYLRNISAHPSVMRELESLSNTAWDAIVAEVRTRIEEPTP